MLRAFNTAMARSELAPLRWASRTIVKPFMYGPLTQSELVEAVLSMKVMTLPRRAGRKRRSKA
jgi:hypothetical protein